MGTTRASVISLLSLILAACGGGGTSDTSSRSVASAGASGAGATAAAGKAGSAGAGAGAAGASGANAGASGAAAGAAGSVATGGAGAAGMSGDAGQAGTAGISGASGQAGAGQAGAAAGQAGQAGQSGAAGESGQAGSAGGKALGPAALCFSKAFVSAPAIGPDYDQFNPKIGSHCLGTNHQDIQGVQRVVFLGDSVTVGTPPTLSTEVYRARLADALAAKFSLKAPDLIWKSADVINGVSLSKTSGDFASCAKWGARTDDLLLPPHQQIADCFPPEELNKRTLVIMTTGGNDIAAITKAGLDKKPIPEIWLMVEDFVQQQRKAIEWFREPGRFPNGVDVIFANMFEFTDGTGDTKACPAAGLAGFGAAWDDTQALADMVIYANEQFMKIAVDTQSDLVFLLESFCGHGFNSKNPAAPCYRGPTAENWFDLTCIHPNPKGHQQVSDMFLAVTKE